ncbi:ATP-binding cassette domain-containing protein [Mycoplasma sp. 1654_15]|uniref:ATP-binding cassette domain-containing protein n=1 Tax=Mycoplasma sp. 1654_15 TaxID=2725994 RepID=UPI0014498A91|nr:ABC transporter ATP-binding protein [Mycoplasma sp. 1654_15]QJB71326.1 ABC transporter ATP-binding protein [Mycoplasma sp. 1654_15]
MVFQILKLEKFRNLIVFLFQNLLTVLLSLHTLSYKFIIEYFSNSTSFNSVLYTWLSINVLSMLFYVLISWFFNKFKLATQARTYQQIQEKIVHNLTQDTVYNIYQNKNKTISFLNEYSNNAILILELFHEHIFKFVSYSVIPLIFMFVISLYSWIILLTIIIANVILLLLILALKPIMQERATQMMNLYEQYGQKQIKAFSLFYVFYFFNKISLFQKTINSRANMLHKQEFLLDFKTDSIIWVFKFINVAFLTLGVGEISFLIYYNLIELDSFLSLFSYLLLFSTSLSFLFNSLLPIFLYAPTLDKIFNKPNSNNIRFKPKQLIETIEFKNVSYKLLESDKYVFTNKSFKIEKGKKYLLSGVSEKRKSAVLNILAGVYRKYEGNVVINKQYEANLLDVNYFREQIGMLESNSTIYNDTLLNNIVIWDKNPNIDLVKNLLKEFKIDHISLEDNIAYSKLSDGEKQRISLARLKYTNFDIWCLDQVLDNIETKFSYEIWYDILKNNKNTIIAISNHIDDKVKDLFDEEIVL